MTRPLAIAGLLLIAAACDQTSNPRPTVTPTPPLPLATSVEVSERISNGEIRRSP